MQWTTFTDLLATRTTNVSAQVALEEIAAKVRAGTPAVVLGDGYEIPLALDSDSAVGLRLAIESTRSV